MPVRCKKLFLVNLWVKLEFVRLLGLGLGGWFAYNAMFFRSTAMARA
jgi:hypothetical protein